LIGCFWAIVNSGQITRGRAYQVASEAVHRPLAPGFGLSTCNKVELIRVVDALKLAVDQQPGRHRAGPTSKVQRPRSKNPANLIVLATQKEISLATFLAQDVFGSAQNDAFRSWLYRMVRRNELRLCTHGQVWKIIEALKQMQARPWHPTGATK
jgi:hypothetical protein